MGNVEQLVKKHAPMVVKKTLAAIASLDRKIESETKRKMELASTASGVRSSAHWKAEAAFELYYKQREILYEELKLLDDITSFTSCLSQDRYKFAEKYPEIIKTIAERG